jgi:hypothetical protein
MKIHYFIIVLCSIGGIACDSGIDSPDSSSFAIYLLKDPSTTASQVWSSPVEALELADTPLLTQREITLYRWQTHQFEVTSPIEMQLTALKNRSGPVGGIPFVATVGRTRIYLGAFWYAYSSLAPQSPYIDVLLDVHRIHAAWINQDQGDVRNDKRIYAALKAAGVLAD